MLFDLFAVFVMPIILLGLMVAGAFGVMVALNETNNKMLGKDWKNGQIVKSYDPFK